jgi:hypothetical protein
MLGPASAVAFFCKVPTFPEQALGMIQPEILPALMIA